MSATRHVIATFYRFAPLPHCATLRAPWLDACRQRQVRGTIVLAEEGINGTIAGDAAAVDEVLDMLRAEPALAELSARIDDTDRQPFQRMKVKLRREIVTLGIDGIDPADGGERVSPRQWNDLLRRPDVVVIDTRNDYEVAIGSFVGARDPGTHRFGDLPAWIDAQAELADRPPVAMFCTGGIRCEKSTALLRARGFNEVYQLDGGILHYLAEIPAGESLWQGECFVFDDRVSLGQGLAPGSHRLCRGCGRPVVADGSLENCAECRDAAAEDGA